MLINKQTNSSSLITQIHLSSDLRLALPGMLIVMLLALCNTSQAGIYKWVDENGKVHYGQQRPTDAAAEKMQVDQYAPQDKSSYKRPGLDKDAKGTDSNEQNQTPETEGKDTPKTESAAEKKRRKAACAQARQQLTQMAAKGRVRSKDKDGNLVYMSQEQKEARMKKMRDAIKKSCK